MTRADVARLCGRVREALESADLDAYAELLHPAVRWGAPGDDSPPCKTRDDVLGWYRAGQAEGRRARVTEVIPCASHIVVGMKVTPGPRHRGEVDRWQVLAVVDGRITDIRGYEDRESAMAAASA